MNVAKIDYRMMIKLFTDDNILAYGRQKKKWFELILCVRNDESSSEESILDINNVDHLLHLLHSSLTKIVKAPKSDFSVNQTYSRTTSRNVNELIDAGIHFKPSGTMSLTHIEFVRGWWWCRATVKLPPIAVDGSTKPMLLNLIAYEMCSPKPHEYSWVTSYICLLDSQFDHPEDVRTLRKAGVLDTSIGSDSEVAKLYNEIGTDLVPHNLAYMKARLQIQRHYDSFRNVKTSLLQLKQEYAYSPRAFLAVVGGVLALFLTPFKLTSPSGVLKASVMIFARF